MPTDKLLKKTIHIKAPTSKVWDALTNPAIIKQWLFGTNVITDWKVGSPILFTGTWNGTEYKDKGNILLFEKEKTFQYNYWSGFSGLPDAPENYSTITFSLLPDNGHTHLGLTQKDFANDTMFEHSDKNWDETLKLFKSICEKS